MPNWCDCELTVTGNKQDLDVFMDKAALDGACLTFVPFVSPPKEYLEYRKEWDEWYKKEDKTIDEPQIRPIGFDWYHWNIGHWGTKWDAAYPSCERLTDTEATYGFSTAWSPPSPVIEAMCEQHPTLAFELRYYESGMGFQGHIIAMDGEVTLEDSSDYDGERGG